MPVLDFEASEPMDLGGGAFVKTVNLEKSGKKAMKLSLPPGFDWAKEIAPKLPGCPASCPATHFGYMVSGSMKVAYDDGTEETIEAGQTYFVKPGHIPTILEGPNAEAIEFSEDSAKQMKAMQDMENLEAA